MVQKCVMMNLDVLGGLKTFNCFQIPKNVICHTLEHQFLTFVNFASIMIVRDNLYFGMNSQKMGRWSYARTLIRYNLNVKRVSEWYSFIDRLMAPSESVTQVQYIRGESKTKNCATQGIHAIQTVWSYSISCWKSEIYVILLRFNNLKVTRLIIMSTKTASGPLGNKNYFLIKNIFSIKWRSFTWD